MNKTEILENIKGLANYVMGKEEPIEEIEVVEDVIVAKPDESIEIKAAEEAPIEDAPVEEPTNENVSKEEFNSKIAEVIAMVDELKSQLGLSQETVLEKDLELKKLKSEKEALKVELDKKPDAPTIKHSPEKKEVNVEFDKMSILERRQYNRENE